MTQHQKILQLHENREWVCQEEYRNISWCPHKRRNDICEGRAKDLEGNKIPPNLYYFDWKECEHGIKGSRDYLLVRRVEQDSVVEEKPNLYKDMLNLKKGEMITFKAVADINLKTGKLENSRIEDYKIEQSEKLNL